MSLVVDTFVVDTKEREFALAIRRTLEESAHSLPQATLERLALARSKALSHKKAATAAEFILIPAQAASDITADNGWNAKRRWPRLTMIWPVLALIAGLAAAAHWENQQRLNETADIDAAMLSDELPLSAYLDHGFHAYLSRAH
jgi:hypothetical protein